MTGLSNLSAMAGRIDIILDMADQYSINAPQSLQALYMLGAAYPSVSSSVRLSVTLRYDTVGILSKRGNAEGCSLRRVF